VQRKSPSVFASFLLEKFSLGNSSFLFHLSLLDASHEVTCACGARRASPDFRNHSGKCLRSPGFSDGWLVISRVSHAAVVGLVAAQLVGNRKYSLPQFEVENMYNENRNWGIRRICSLISSYP
jgi:hypothetical protein